MATTKTTEEKFNGNGSLKVFPFTIEYLLTSDLQVFIGNVLQTETTHYSISGSNLTFVTAPASGTSNVRIARSTGIDAAQRIYATGSSVRAKDLNANQDQVLFALQERLNTIDGQVSSTAPAGAANGDRWYDAVSGRTYVYYTDADSSQWVEASPPLNSNFTQTGTGAVSRTVNSKLRDVISVKDFGAKGDNTTDDTAAIQAAIDSIKGTDPTGGGVVKLPKGIYRTSRPLIIYSNVCLMGDGLTRTYIKPLDNATFTLNQAVIQSKDFNTTANQAGTGQWTYYPDNYTDTLVMGAGLRELCVDGNNDNVANAIGVAIYGAKWNFFNLAVINTGSHGIWTEAGRAGDSTSGDDLHDYLNMHEAFSSNIYISNANKHGWLFRGPNDSSIGDVQIKTCLWGGFFQESTGNNSIGNLEIRSIHAYACSCNFTLRDDENNIIDPAMITLANANVGFCYVDASRKNGLLLRQTANVIDQVLVLKNNELNRGDYWGVIVDSVAQINCIRNQDGSEPRLAGTQTVNNNVITNADGGLLKVTESGLSSIIGQVRSSVQTGTTIPQIGIQLESEATIGSYFASNYKNFGTTNAWNNSTAYSTDDRVTSNGRLYKATGTVNAGGTAPNNQWTGLLWQNGTNYAIGKVVKASNNKIYKAAATITGGTEPSHTTNEIVDDWEFIEDANWLEISSKALVIKSSRTNVTMSAKNCGTTVFYETRGRNLLSLNAFECTKEVDYVAPAGDTDYIFVTSDTEGRAELNTGKLITSQMQRRVHNITGAINNVKIIDQAAISESSGVLTSNRHGFVNGDTVRYLSNGANLVTGTSTTVADGDELFVVNADTNTFKLASTSGGTALQIANDGSDGQTFTKVISNEYTPNLNTVAFLKVAPLATNLQFKIPTNAVEGDILEIHIQLSNTTPTISFEFTTNPSTGYVHTYTNTNIASYKRINLGFVFINGVFVETYNSGWV